MGEYTTNNKFYKPSLGAMGSTEKGKFDDALDATDNEIANLVTKREFISDYTTFESAIDSISNTPTILIIDDDVTLNENNETPSTLYLEILPGITINGAHTLTISSPANIIAQPNQQIFGSTTINFDNGGNVYADWWGENGAAITDAASALHSSGKGGNILLNIGVYDAGTTTITLGKGVNLYGSGLAQQFSGVSDPTVGTIITYTGSGNCIELAESAAGRQTTLSNFVLDLGGSTGSATGIYTATNQVTKFSNIQVIDSPSTGYALHIAPAGQHYFIERFMAAGQVIKINGSTTRITTSVILNSKFGHYDIDNVGQITLINATGEGDLGVGQPAIKYDFNDVLNVNMIGCDVEGSGTSVVSLTTVRNIFMSVSVAAPGSWTNFIYPTDTSPTAGGFATINGQRTTIYASNPGGLDIIGGPIRLENDSGLYIEDSGGTSKQVFNMGTNGRLDIMSKRERSAAGQTMFKITGVDQNGENEATLLELKSDAETGTGIRLILPDVDVATTVGAAGGADALPATPDGYLQIWINGTEKRIPYYAIP